MYSQPKQMIRIMYDFKNKKDFSKIMTSKNEFVEQLLSEIDELDSLVHYLNAKKDLPLINILNHIKIKLYVSEGNNYLSMDFSKSNVQIRREDIDFKYQNESHSFNIDKNFIFKIEKDGSINRNSVLFKYLFSICEDFYKINYLTGFKDIASYLKVIEMASI